MEKKEKTVRLFDEFPPVTTTEWEEQILKDLKGADYKKKLVWKTMQGFDVKPYYRSEDLKDLPHLKVPKDHFNLISGNKTIDNSWHIRQDFVVNDINEASLKVRKAIENGAESIGFIFPENCDIGHENLTILLSGIDIGNTEINFLNCAGFSSILPMLRVECERRNTDPAVVKGSLDHDPIGYFSVNGNFFGRSEQLSFKEAKNNIEFARRYIPHFRVVTVNGQYFSNSGSSILQELAFSLAAGNDYLSILTGLDLSVDDVASSIRFNFAIGADYFMEIARLRAARLLWAKIVEAYGTQNAESMKMSLHTFTSRWYKTIYDPHVNMLRATTEAMASVIGGSDSLTVEPFDNVHKDPNEFSVRYSRNIQNICREEAYLGKVIDPAAGSYYVESLTHSFVNEAWKYFIEIQESGGYTEAFKAGLIQREISTLAGQRDMNIAMRKEILLGTNQYPIIMEKAGNINVREQHKEKGSEIIAEPLKPYRGAKAFEELRRRTELSGRIPNVFLFPFGNLAMQKARANFASNFFGCAGFRIIDNTGFRSLDSGIATAGKSKADIVVLCSSDDEYAAAVPVIWEKLKDKTIVVVAGYPQNLIEEFSRLGLKYFIHIRSNVLETLKDFQEELGI